MAMAGTGGRRGGRRLTLSLAPPVYALLFLCLARSAASMVPTSPVRVEGARAGVIGQLFPAAAQQLWFSSPLLRTSFKAKKQAALRWRTAQARSIVERCTRETKALEARAVPGDAFAEDARRARLGELRQEAGVTEGRILLLKARQRRLGLPPRKGWVGDTTRLVETWLATEERSARVLLSLLRQQRDPWDLIRQDTISLLRLGSNAALVAGYAQLPGMDRLAPHAPAIAARAAKLERYAP